MLKWVGGCALVAVVVIGVVVYVGYSQVTAITDDGPTSTAVIHAPAERVFASIADADSMSEWRLEGLGIKASRDGLLEPGDTVMMQAAGGRQRMTWLVSEVVPNVVVAAQLRSDSGQVIMERRDSVEALGDSTRVHVTLLTPALDSMRAGRDDERRPPAFASKLLIGGMRMQSERELQNLKRRIEGTDSAATPRGSPPG